MLAPHVHKLQLNAEILPLEQLDDLLQVVDALPGHPDLLVLDEPSSGLDPVVRRDILGAIIRTIADEGRTVLFSSHLLDEVERVADRVAIMRDGKIEQIGTPEDIYNRPRTRFVADFVGSANLIKGRVVGRSAAGGTVSFGAQGGITLEAIAPGAVLSGDVEVAVRTAYIDVVPAPGENHLPGKVRQRMFHGDFVQYIVECPCGRLIVRRPPVNLLDEGAAVTLTGASPTPRPTRRPPIDHWAPRTRPH